MSIKRDVQDFYNRVGWQQVGDPETLLQGRYQNATYEDLRPVSQEYIQRCHARVARHLKPAGQYLLDAGSGPIQYQAYLAYSTGYQHRVCVDISIVALQAAREQIGEHGLYVVADVANLPFAPGAFDGVVSLHTIHHLPQSEHGTAYHELYRVLAPASTAIVVNGWQNPPLMGWVSPFLSWLRGFSRRSETNKTPPPASEQPETEAAQPPDRCASSSASLLSSPGVFVSKYNAAWLRQELARALPPTARLEIFCWRSVNVAFLRAFIRPRLAGRFILRVLFALEERLPRFFGENGQYPLIVIRKEP